MSIRTPHVTGYFIEADTDSPGKLSFQFNPEQFRDEGGANYADHRPQGSSHPRKQFVGGKGRKIQFQLRIYGSKNGMTCKQQVDWIRSLAYPDTQTDNIPHRAPNRVFVNFGGLYRGLLVVVSDVSVTWSNHMDSRLNPIEATVDVTLEEFSVGSVDYRDVRSGRR